MKLKSRKVNNMTVFEFDDICVGHGEKQLIESDFKLLKNFILPKIGVDDEKRADDDVVTDASVCMTLWSKGGKEVIRVKNYVGVISLKSGTIIEVLPKISNISTNNEKCFARRLVIEMLKACGKIPYKSFQKAKLSYEKMNLYEIFIRLFLDKLNELYKKGLWAGYVPFEDNENFLKGKLIFNEHIKRNFAHKEKFYVGYEVFSFDRVENRLIKSTLQYLKSKSNDESNKRDIRRMLLIFEDITPSQNYDSDFARCGSDRTVKDYADILLLCKIFLHKMSFTMYSGKTDATALMFPMEKLYEKYIAHEMQEAMESGWYLQAQSREKYLFNKRQFLLQPDMILKKGNEIVIVDTKWKKLDKKKPNFGISQSDMYQMYAYHTRFENCNRVVLLYPYCKEVAGVSATELIYTTTISANEGNSCREVIKKEVRIYIAFFNLEFYLSDKKFRECLYPNNDWTNLLKLK